MLEIRQCGNKDLERFYPMIQVDFDAREIIPKRMLRRALVNGSAELLSITETESGLNLGYAYVVKENMYGYVLLKYFGIFSWYRGKGIGVEAMRLLNRRYASTRGIIAELTEFPDRDPEHLKKLFRFFARFGYVEVKCGYYISGTRAHVFVKPVKGTDEIAPVIGHILPDFYSRFMPLTERERMFRLE